MMIRHDTQPAAQAASPDLYWGGTPTQYVAGESTPPNEMDQALTALYRLVGGASGSRAGWLDWSRGKFARLPDGLVEIHRHGATPDSEHVFIRGEVLLALFSAGLIRLGFPTLHGLVLTAAGAQRAKRLLTEAELP